MYRRRRIVALLLVLGLVGGATAGIWFTVAALTGDDGVPTTAATNPGGNQGGTAGEGAATPSSTPTPSPTEPAIGATPPLPVSCTAEEAALTVTAPAVAAAGSAVQATVGVTVTGSQPCLVDLGSEALLVQVYSGEDLIWTSAHCPFAPSQRALLIPAGASDEQAVRWPGGRSSEGCPGDGEAALPGTYRIVATQTREEQVLTAEATLVLE